MVSVDKIQHVRSKSELSAKQLLKGRKHSRKALHLWFLSLFQNLAACAARC